VCATNTLVAPRPSDARATSDVADSEVTEAHDKAHEALVAHGEPVALGARVRDADGQAVASFVMGLAGLLVFNLILGPCALVLGGLALMRGTTRPGRAVLGLALGAADLIVLAAVTAADNTVSWSLMG